MGRSLRACPGRAFSICVARRLQRYAERPVTETELRSTLGSDGPAPADRQQASGGLSSTVRGVLVCALSLAAGTRAAAQPSTVPVGRERLALAVSEFQAAWQRAWRDSEEYRRLRIPQEVYRQRFFTVHCHSDYWDPVFRQRWNFNPTSLAPNQVIIDRRIVGHTWCPRWMVTPSLIEADDESVWRDLALRPAYRAGIAAKRARLLSVLDSAYRLAPQDAWLAGQSVRFHLEALDVPHALEAAATCRAAAAWCAALAGLVHTRAGAIVSVDSAFTVMRRAMSDSARCQWDDVVELLTPTEQEPYRTIGCGQRIVMAERLWWLADPLWRDPGNARRAEHDARRTEIALRLTTAQDERLVFDRARGGESVAAMIVRYGWPTYRTWLGRSGDREHDRYVQEELRGVQTPPYTSFEYALDRAHTVPTWRAVTDPFRAVPGDWQLAAEDSTGHPSATQWPAEHFKPARRLVALPDGQTITVRRQSFVEVVSALTLSHPAQLRSSERFDVMLLASNGPDKVDSLDRQWAAGGDTVRLRGRLAGGATLLAIEAAGPATTPLDARTRFGYAAPQPLSALAADEPAMSEIALLSTLDPGLLLAPTDTVLRNLRPTRTLAAEDRRLTVYCESYNVSAADSAQVALRVVPTEKAGALRELGNRLRLLDDPTRGSRSAGTTTSGVTARARSRDPFPHRCAPWRWTWVNCGRGPTPSKSRCDDGMGAVRYNAPRSRCYREHRTGSQSRRNVSNPWCGAGARGGRPVYGGRTNPYERIVSSEDLRSGL